MIDCFITFNSCAIFSKSSALNVSQTVIAGSCIMKTPFLGILIVSPAIAIIVAAEAAHPSTFTVIFASWSFSRVYIAFAANTSPPGLLIRTIISGTSSPNAASSLLNCAGVTRSSHQLCWLLIVPYRSNSGGFVAVPGTKSQNLFCVTPNGFFSLLPVAVLLFVWLSGLCPVVVLLFVWLSGLCPVPLLPGCASGFLFPCIDNFLYLL